MIAKSKKRNSLPVEWLRKFFIVKDGVLLHNLSTPKRYARRRAGPIGGINNTGYLCCEIQGKRLLTHRVIFAMHYGYWPHMVDHINGIKTDNRIENLRVVDASGNAQNFACHRRGQPIGVHKRTGESKWTAMTPTRYLNYHGKRKYLGKYHTKKEAERVVKLFCEFGIFQRVRKKTNPYIGVRWVKARGWWLAQAPTKHLNYVGKQKYLGVFKTKEEAHKKVESFCGGFHLHV